MLEHCANGFAVDLINLNGIVEREYRKEIAARDGAARQIRSQIAAVADRDVGFRLPTECVRYQIAQFGFLLANNNAIARQVTIRMRKHFIKQFLIANFDVGKRALDQRIGFFGKRRNFVFVKQLGSLGNDAMIFYVHFDHSKIKTVAARLRNQSAVDFHAVGERGMTVSVDDDINALRFARNPFARKFRTAINAHMHQRHQHINL